MEKFIVTEKAQRPAKMDGTCFYCSQPIGAAHKDDCVLIRKRVRLKMTVVYEVDVPAFWDKDAVESHRNIGTWCANNAIDELNNLPGCLCDYAKFEFIEDTSGRELDED